MAEHDENMIYMLLDYHPGGELYSVMVRQQGPLFESQALFYTACLADALHYIHGCRIVYRDLKPENVVIDRAGYPVLVDFGYARRLTSGKAHTLCGTPRFASPEMIQGLGHDFSADHWSLGILIYEMLAGENPFYMDGMDEPTLYRSIAEDDCNLPVGVSDAAVDVVSRLLIKDPRSRLGCKEHSEILGHKWLSGLNFSALKRRDIEAPWIPCTAHALDTRYFDDWDHLEDKVKQQHIKLVAAEAAMFDEF